MGQLNKWDRIWPTSGLPWHLIINKLTSSTRPKPPIPSVVLTSRSKSVMFANSSFVSLVLATVLYVNRQPRNPALVYTVTDSTKRQNQINSLCTSKKATCRVRWSQGQVILYTTGCVESRDTPSPPCLPCILGIRVSAAQERV